LFDSDLHIEFCRLVGELGDMHFRIQNFHLARSIYFLCCCSLDALYLEIENLWLFRSHLDAELLEVEKDGDDIFLDTVYRRKFVFHPLYLDPSDSCAGKRGKDDSAERVAERMPIAGIKSVNFINAVKSILSDDLWL